MNRRQLKEEAKSILSNHFKFFALLVLPFVIFNIMYRIVYQIRYNDYLQQMLTTIKNANMANPNASVNFNSLSSSYLLIFEIIIGLLAISLSFTALNAIRGQNNFKTPFIQSTFIISDKRYFWGSILIAILKFVFILLWAIMFIIIGSALWLLPIAPGDKISIDAVILVACIVVTYIKSLSYSQAYLVYYDALRHHKSIGFVESITKSRELLKGHLGELFVINLSFIGWWILAGITFGIALIWIYPYFALTMANYYDHLLKLQK